MAGWVGPTIAISLLIIAICVVAVTSGLLVAAKKAAEGGHAIAREMSELRGELGPALRGLDRIGNDAGEIAGLAKREAQEIVDLSRRLRGDVEKGVTRTRERLADFEAVVDVVQDEVEASVVDLGVALRSLRAGTAMMGQLRRLVRRRKRRKV